MKSVTKILLHYLDFISGSLDNFTLRHRLFNTVTLTIGVASLISSPFNYILGFSVLSVVMMLVFGGVLLGFYYKGRIEQNYKPFVWPLFIMFLLILYFVWFYRGGSHGSGPYFFLLSGVLGPLLLKGWPRYLVAAIFYATLAAFFYAEYNHPELVTLHNTVGLRYLDIIFNLFCVMLLVGSALLFVASNFYNVYDKVQDYKTQFYEDLTLARMLQERVFNYDPEMVKGFDVDVFNRPSSQLSGDLYDFSRPNPKTLRILLADARGHGINSSLSAMIIKSEWNNLSQSKTPPAKLLAKLNRLMMERYGDSISFSAIVIDIAGTTLTYASGGHVPQFLINSNELIELEATGTLLGMIEDSKYTQQSIPFKGSSRLFLYTDALLEENDQQGELIGKEWLISTITSQHNSAKELSRDVVNRFAAGLGQQPDSLDCTDDLTIIVVGR